MNLKRRLYKGVAAPTALCRAETLSMTVKEKKKLNVMEKRYLWSMC